MRRWDQLWLWVVGVVGIVLVSCSGDSGEGVIAGGGSGLDFEEASAVYHGFSGERAMKHVEAVVDLGPRPPGSAKLEACRKYVEEELGALGWRVYREEFEELTPLGRIKFVNLRARFVGKEGGSLDWNEPVAYLLGGHYDTKYYSKIRFVGANDAGSSTGGLIECGRALAGKPGVARCVELVFFDGEECFVQYSATDGLYGSRHYARNLRRQKKESWPGAVVILDMIAEKGAFFRVPSNTSAALREALGESAKVLGTEEHFGRQGSVLDDHEPFHVLGIPTLNVIDLEYGPWHTAGDTMDKLSAESMEWAAKAVLRMIEVSVSG